MPHCVGIAAGQDLGIRGAVPVRPISEDGNAPCSGWATRASRAKIGAGERRDHLRRFIAQSMRSFRAVAVAAQAAAGVFMKPKNHITGTGGVGE